MCDKELLVGYLYDELSPAERSKFEAHLFACAECRDEVAGLRAARAHLAAWAPPEPDLGFQIIRGGAPSGGRRWYGLSPAWGLAAAAALVLAVASAIANLDVRLGREGVVVRTGWVRHAPAAPAPTASPAPQLAATASDEAVRADLLRVDNRLRELETAVKVRGASTQAVAAATPRARLSEAEVRQIHDIVAQSEARWQRELALQIAQVVKDGDLQRRTDLARIQQVLSRLEAYTGAEVAQQREMLNRFVRVSQGR